MALSLDADENRLLPNTDSTCDYNEYAASDS
jgi:hypothetical protein